MNYKSITIMASTLSISNIAQSSIQCEELDSLFQPSSTLKCQNTSSTGKSTVFFRSVPPWKENSGITIVDICSGENISNAENNTCVRRICSQESKTLFLRVGPIAYPVGGIAGFFAFSIAHADFEVHCKFIHDSNEE